MLRPCDATSQRRACPAKHPPRRCGRHRHGRSGPPAASGGRPRPPWPRKAVRRRQPLAASRRGARGSGGEVGFQHPQPFATVGRSMLRPYNATTRLQRRACPPKPAPKALVASPWPDQAASGFGGRPRAPWRRKAVPRRQPLAASRRGARGSGGEAGRRRTRSRCSRRGAACCAPTTPHLNAELVPRSTRPEGVGGIAWPVQAASGFGGRPRAPWRRKALRRRQPLAASRRGRAAAGVRPVDAAPVAVAAVGAQHAAPGRRHISTPSLSPRSTRPVGVGRIVIGVQAAGGFGARPRAPWREGRPAGGSPSPRRGEGRAAAGVRPAAARHAGLLTPWRNPPGSTPGRGGLSAPRPSASGACSSASSAG